MKTQTHTTTTHNPIWWTEKHTSNWDHIKGGFERDWEQTKADFSKDSGQQLNQNVSDTVKQSMGSQPIPPLGVKTHPTDPKVAGKAADNARENMARQSADASGVVSKARENIGEEKAKLQEKLTDIRKDQATDQAKASGKISDARGDAAQGVAKERVKILEAGAKRDGAIAKWRDAEREARYGFSARSQYPDSSWDEKLEGKLQVEWDGLGTGTAWSASRASIHRGWDYASKKS